MRTRYWLIVILAILLLFGADKYLTSSKMDKLLIDLANYNGNVDSLILSNNALVTSNKSLQLTTQNQMKEIAAKNDTVAKMIKKFKQVQNITYITNNFEAKGDSSDFNIPIPCDFKPFKDTISTPSYVLEQTISNKGTKVDRLFVPNEQKLVFGTKKKGLFRSEHYVDVNNSNDLMVASNIKNYTFVPTKRWFEKPLITGSIGFGVGFLANSIILQTLK